MSKAVNWDEVGKRLFQYRTEKNITVEDFSRKCGLKESTVYKLEEGFVFTNENNLWAIIRAENLDPNWFLYGHLKQDISDTSETSVLPIAVKNKKGVGIRKDENKLSADSGQHSDELFEFLLALEAYKKVNSKFFISYSETFQILCDLGYRKSEKPIINPLAGAI